MLLAYSLPGAFLLMAVSVFTLLPANDAAKTLASGVQADDKVYCAARAGPRLEARKTGKAIPENHAEKFGRCLDRSETAGEGVSRAIYINIFYSSKVLVPMALCLVATVPTVHYPLFVYALRRPRVPGARFLAE